MGNPNNPINPDDPNPGGGNPPPANQRTGKAITLSSNGYQRISEQALSFTQQNFGVLKVDGQELNIIPPNIVAGGLLNMQARNTARVRQVMTQSSYGYVREGTDAQGYMFSQGIVTSANDMPTSGTFNYSGYAVHAPVSNQTNAQIETGAANFNVNFGNRTISGTLTPTNNATVVLDNAFPATALAARPTLARNSAATSMAAMPTKWAAPTKNKVSTPALSAHGESLLNQFS